MNRLSLARRARPKPVPRVVDPVGLISIISVRISTLPALAAA
jgi:hypothetical protein